MSARRGAGPHRAQRQASARDPRRRLHRRLGRRTVRVGKPALPQYYLPSSAFVEGSLGPSSTSGRHSPSRGDDSSTCTAATVSHWSPCGRTTTHRFPSWTDASDSSGTPWTPGSKKTRKCSYIRATHRPRGDPPELPPRRCRGRGYVVAESRHPTFLYETRLPSNVHPEARRRHGTAGAHRHNVAVPVRRHREVLDGHDRRRIHSDLVWSYPTPRHESANIAGLVAFYDEQVDLTVDGQLQTRPTTHFVIPPPTTRARGTGG